MHANKIRKHITWLCNWALMENTVALKSFGLLEKCFGSHSLGSLPYVNEGNDWIQIILDPR